jgi:integrase
MAQLQKLTPLSVKNAKGRDSKYRLSDGGNLYFVVRPSGAKSWSFVFKEHGRPREFGLGSFPSVSLKAARTIAANLRNARAGGEDVATVLNPPQGMTFGDAARGAYEKRAPGFRSRHTDRQWQTDLFSRLSHWDRKPVAAIDLKQVADILRPVLENTPESGRRFRTRIEAAFSYAIALGEYDGANPARWKDGLENVLPAPSRAVKHHKALPYKDAPALIRDLATRTALSARCLELLVLTAARTTQARGARWDEFDFQSRIWTVPEDRMKAERVHYVPLSEACLNLLNRIGTDAYSDFLFPGNGREGHLSDAAMLTLLKRMGYRGKDTSMITVHGFRSTLMDWMENETSYQRDLGEHALSHAVGSQAFRAYARGSELERRRQMMEAWGSYCAGTTNTKVVPLYG